jgi:hypothetical protein
MSATLLPLRPCRRNTFQKGEFPLHSHPPRARRNAASNRAFSFSQCAISARDLSSRASIWAWMSAAFFSCFRRAAPKALCALATARCRRSRSFCWATSSARPGCVTRCSVRPILEVPRYPPFPCSPLMTFRATDTVFGDPNAANIWNGRFAPTADVPRESALDPGCMKTRLSQGRAELFSQLPSPKRSRRCNRFPQRRN